MKILILSSSKIRHLNLFLQFKKNYPNVTYFSERIDKKKIRIKSSLPINNYFQNLNFIENKIFFKDINKINNIYKDVEFINNFNNPTKKLMRNIEDSDFVINFGTRFIKKPLIDLLIKKKTINIHMGISPYYRGNASNFWASYDRNYNMIGSTIHYISKGLDSGRILYTLSPKINDMKLNYFTMYSVKKVHDFLSNNFNFKKELNKKGYKQNNKLLIRYTKKIDFNDKILDNYYKLNIADKKIKNLTNNLSINTQFHKII